MNKHDQNEQTASSPTHKGSVEGERTCPLCGPNGLRPNAKTIAAICELEAGGGKSASTIEELMADLNSDD